MARKILVVDDTEHILQNMKAFLEMEGYQVSTALNGEEGLGRLGTDLPDLIITDLVMPKMDGVTFIREIKKQGRLRNIPILIFSAKPLEGKNVADLGADRFVLKPCQLEILLDYIIELIAK